MTLWFDGGTIVSYYIVTDNRDGIQFEEKTDGDRAFVDLIIESGISFNINIKEYMNQFRGCNPNISIEETTGTAHIIDCDTQELVYRPNEGFAFQPNETCKVVFSADRSSTSSNFSESKR